MKLISENIVTLDIKYGKNEDIIRVVNYYAPTNPNVKKNPAILEEFYDQLTSAIDIPTRRDVYHR